MDNYDQNDRQPLSDGYDSYDNEAEEKNTGAGKAPEPVKQEKSRKRKGRRIGSSVAIVLGMLLILAAVGLVAYNMNEAIEAGKSAERNSEILSGMIDENRVEAERESELNAQYPDQVLNVDDRKIRGMPTEEIDGNQYIGQLEVPSVKVSLPVMYNWNYKQLRIAPCRYSGSYYSDDLVICGHNYRSHFSPLRSVSPGADVYFITVKGEQIHYIVSNVEQVKPTGIEEMIANSNNSDSTSEWDLTLFTCTLGGRTRYALRCVRADED